MNREDALREIQKRIALARGYTDLHSIPVVTRPFVTELDLQGTLHADEGPTLVPRWPWDWCDAGALVEEMRGVPGETDLGKPTGCDIETTTPGHAYGCCCTVYVRGAGAVWDEGETPEEAIARCWCAWQDIDLSDLP